MRINPRISGGAGGKEAADQTKRRDPRRVAIRLRRDGGRVWCMAQPHKGDRMLVQSRVPRAVWEEMRRRAAKAGLPVSQYAADLLAVHVGRPDLVRSLPSQEGLPLAM